MIMVPCADHAGSAINRLGLRARARARATACSSRAANGLKYSQKIYFLSLYTRLGRSDSPIPCTGTRTESLALTHTCIAEAKIGASRPPARAVDALLSAVCAHPTPQSHPTAIQAHMAHSTSTACKHKAGKHAGRQAPLAHAAVAAAAAAAAARCPPRSKKK